MALFKSIVDLEPIFFDGFDMVASQENAKSSDSRRRGAKICGHF